MPEPNSTARKHNQCAGMHEKLVDATEKNRKERKKVIFMAHMTRKKRNLFIQSTCTIIIMLNLNNFHNALHISSSHIRTVHMHTV